MNCLSCEQNLDAGSKDGYHLHCARRLFGSSYLPKVDFTIAEIPIKAREMIGKISISGVQPKLSIFVNKKQKNIQVTAKGGTHILKPSPDYFPNLAENENLCMNLASEAGIETPHHGLLPASGGGLIYIIKRFDRIFEDGIETKIPTEDFCQLLEKDDKYTGSIEQIGDFLKRHSESPFIDTQRLFIRTVLNFLIGNGDAHLKNFAMIRPTGRSYRLSPAYDVVSSRLVIPNESDEFAITVNGKKNNILFKDFTVLAGALEIPAKQLQSILDKIKALESKFKTFVERSFLPEEKKSAFMVIFEERCRRIF